ncbi:YggS family pyridoxal phosphate-dependent enzyme [Paenibacillus farraposensis]|uniref:Pyridoxal phosphate homeostasis protein n=1 Tax=Paenibacillus farraposensis TaxID=2807095 RepID=A0ABW4D8T6_9BACL|nr:YggS family pyridoxal phosphate-dependent enzyme [Paenibacillus farraposensis]MCC3381535.1 YggS family pyridoxal phosphate-dependent enzyme [Paenibacillus farraposensis]
MSLQDRLSTVEHRIREACGRCGRSEEEIQIIAVTKYTTAKATEQVLLSGLTHVGESRAQEAKSKWEVLQPRGTWHFIGHLQTNKVKEVIGKFEYIHSLDRLSLMKEIEKQAAGLNVVVNCFIQVNVSGEKSKQGLAPETLFSFAQEVSRMKQIRVVGLMTMAPHESDAEATRPVFRELKRLRDELNTREIFAYPVPHLSMGMSNDFEVAIEEGATWLRLGSILVGRGPIQEKEALT